MAFRLGFSALLTGSNWLNLVYSTGFFTIRCVFNFFYFIGIRFIGDTLGKIVLFWALWFYIEGFLSIILQLFIPDNLVFRDETLSLFCFDEWTDGSDGPDLPGWLFYGSFWKFNFGTVDFLLGGSITRFWNFSTTLSLGMFLMVSRVCVLFSLYLSSQ